MTETIRTEPAAFRRATPEVAAAIKSASAESGVSFSYLMTKAATESGFKADAKAPTSSATGLYQFIERTWLNMVKEHGDKVGLDRYADALENGKVDRSMRQEILDLRKDPSMAAKMAAQYACENKEHLERKVGGKVGDTELYLAHFLGPAGAERFLKACRADPNRSAASVCPDAARANRNIFYDKEGPRTLKEVYEHFAAKFNQCEATDASALLTRPVTPAASSQPLPGAIGATTPSTARSAAPPPVLSPTAYAARIFMAGLSMPGEAGNRAMAPLR